MIALGFCVCVCVWGGGGSLHKNKNISDAIGVTVIKFLSDLVAWMEADQQFSSEFYHFSQKHQHRAGIEDLTFILLGTLCIRKINAFLFWPYYSGDCLTSCTN